MTFVGCERLNAECVNVGLLQIAEGRVNHAVALQPVFAGKCGSHDAHGIVTATGMRVTGVARAIVADFQLQGPEFGLHVRLQILQTRVRSDGVQGGAQGRVLRKGLTATLAYTPAAA